MYKTASKFTNPYSIGQGGDFGILSEKKFERYYVDSFGNPVGPDYSTMDDSRAKVTNSHRTIKSPQPYHKRLWSSSTNDSGIKFGVTNLKYNRNIARPPGL